MSSDSNSTLALRETVRSTLKLLDLDFVPCFIHRLSETDRIDCEGGRTDLRGLGVAGAEPSGGDDGDGGVALGVGGRAFPNHPQRGPAFG